MNTTDHQGRTTLRKLVPSLVLATAMAALAPLAHAQPAQTLADMVDFDAIYIPALASTSAAQTQPNTAARAAAATQRLLTQWPTMRQRLADDAPGREWSQMLGTVQKHVEQGAALAGRQDWAGAHEALEHVRLVMLAERRRAGIEYYVDRLTEFHEVMEVIFNAGELPMTPQRRATIEQAYGQARALWRAVEQAPMDVAAYKLTPARENQWRRNLAEESDAMTRLSEALRGSDDKALVDAAKAIKAPFSRAFTAFGMAEGEKR